LKVIAFFLLILLIGGGVFTFFTTYSAYLGHKRRVEEVMLQQNLYTMRKAVEFYADDKGKRPQSLDELVSAGYLREIPADPLTGSNKTWTIEREKESSVPYANHGIVDIRSGAPGADKYGKHYNQY